MKNERANEWSSKKYQRWRIRVFERDQFSCQTCGSKERLHAHHIAPYKKCVEKRYDIDNGQTLCIICHTRLEGTGRNPSPDTRKKMRESRVGYKHSEDTKKKISEGHKGISPSQEVRERISKKLKGIVSWNKGKKHTQEHKQALRGKRPHVVAWNKGIPLTDEVKKKLSLTRKGRPSPNKGRKMRLESIEKMKITKKINFEMKRRGINHAN